MLPRSKSPKLQQVTLSEVLAITIISRALLMLTHVRNPSSGAPCEDIPPFPGSSTRGNPKAAPRGPTTTDCFRTPELYTPPPTVEHTIMLKKVASVTPLPTCGRVLSRKCPLPCNSGCSAATLRELTQALPMLPMWAVLLPVYSWS
jgi:hypothetical protein